MYFLQRSLLNCKLLQESKRSSDCLAGRNDNNIKVIFPKAASRLEEITCAASEVPIRPGDYVVVKIDEANSQVLKGTALCRTTLQEFHR